MDKTLYLCFACAAALTEAFTVRELPMPMKNAKCDRCGRTVWGATYRICIKNNRSATDQSRATVK